MYLLFKKKYLQQNMSKMTNKCAVRILVIIIKNSVMDWNYNLIDNSLLVLKDRIVGMENI